MSLRKDIYLLESFYTGSHKRWADDVKKHSSHQIRILNLPGKHWKWRMHGAAISFANQLKNSTFNPDCFLLTDMTDLSVFRALTQKDFPKARYHLYFHENQISYPWSKTDEDVKLQRNNHYGFINYHSALSADKVFFNSLYHKDIFLNSLPAFLSQFPDLQNLDTIEQIETKSHVLPIGIDWERFRKLRKAAQNKTPTLLWNHRWEYDKNPKLFFDTLKKLKIQGFDFNLIILGEKTKSYLPIFDEAKIAFKDQLIHFGYCENKEAYYQLVAQADFLPVTSNQDFFGYSIVEAIALGVHPILPNRLVYPNHIDTDNNALVFYNDDLNFESKLKECLSQTPIDFSSNVTKYNWASLIDQYDAHFSL